MERRGLRLVSAVTTGLLAFGAGGCTKVGTPTTCETGSNWEQSKCKDDARKPERGDQTMRTPECKRVTYQVVPDRKNGGNNIIFSADMADAENGFSNPHVDGDIYRGVTSPGPKKEPYGNSGLSTKETDDNGITNVTMAVSYDTQTPNGETVRVTQPCPQWLDLQR